MTDVTIMGKFTGNDETGLEITEDSGKRHWVVARKAICKELENYAWGLDVKIRGYINDKHEIVASKVYIVLGED